MWKFFFWNYCDYCLKICYKEIIKIIIESNIEIKNYSLFTVQLFMGTRYSLKISEDTVYICPFKTNDVKIETIFSLKLTIKVTFPLKKSYSIIVLTWIMPHFWIPLSLPPPTFIWTCPLMMKKTHPTNHLSFSKLKLPYLLGGWGHHAHSAWKNLQIVFKIAKHMLLQYI